MKKIILKILIIITLAITIIITYLTTIGFKTQIFNNQIKDELKKINKNLEIDLKEIKIVLDPFNFKIIAKTIGPKLEYGDNSIEIETIKTQISINSFINKKFSLLNLEISTKSLEIKNLLSFLRLLKKSPELYILERLIKKGYIVADINLEFDSEGNIKDNYKIKGFVKDTKFSLFKKYNFEKLNFVFNLVNTNSIIRDLDLIFNDIPISSEKIKISNKLSYFLIDGEINNNDVELSKKFIDLFLKPNLNTLDIKKINLSSNNQFSFKINKKLNVDNFKLFSQIKLNNFTLHNAYKLKEFLPSIKNEISFLDHSIKVNYEKENLSIEGNGELSMQDDNDKIDYFLKKIDKSYELTTSLEINNNPFVINFLDYKKNQKTKTSINLNLKHTPDQGTIIDNLSLYEEKNKIVLEKLELDEKFRIESFRMISFDYFDTENKKNKLDITNKKNNYLIKGITFNANSLIESLIEDNNNKLNIFKNDFDIILSFNEVYLGQDHYINNLKGNLQYKKNKIVKGNLDALFSKNEKFKFTISSNQNEKVTTLFLGKAEPLVKRYKFIKGYEEGQLDFHSSTKNNESISTLKIYDFKLKELPALTKLLTLASLQGIADILSGEGIRFDEFEMNFKNRENLMTINEIYAIGPAISILMDGYVEKNKVISLRGTLVPATTINSFIGSLPVLGKILVGSKTGEGVFGVSFKIKGSPKNLETTVNPIKTLTPRFITRTLEKIKKN